MSSMRWHVGVWILIVLASIFVGLLVAALTVGVP